MEVTRTAGLTEKRCIVRDNLALYNNIVLIATYHGHPPITESDVIRALKRCVCEHPALATTVRAVETESFNLTRPGHVDVRRHLRISDATAEASGSLQQILARLHHEPVAEGAERPQWRAYLIRLEAGFHLAFDSSHALADGISGYAFHGTFVQALRDMASSDLDDDSPILETANLGPPPPALENAGNLSISWSFLLGPLVNTYFPKLLTKLLGMCAEKAADTWYGAPERPALPEDGGLLPTAVRLFAVSADELQIVLSQCRARGCRLTGLLGVLVARALTIALHKRGHRFSSFQSSFPINLRRALGTGHGKMANYASATTETITIDPASLSEHKLSEHDWMTIRNITARLSAASQTLADQPVALLKYLSNFREWTLHNAKAPADASFEISNSGVFDSAASTSSEWSVHEMLFSQSANGVGPPINFNVASAKGGNLNMTVTWWRGMLGVVDEEVFVGEVCETVSNHLRRFAA